MKQHLLWNNSLNKKDTTQTVALKITATMKTENADECVVGNSLHTNDLVKLFDCPDIVFKDWNFYEDNYYQSILFPAMTI